jgi:F-type H+-transporting ATPase subunit b
MRRLLLILILTFATTALFAQHSTDTSATDSTGGTAAHGAESEAHKVAHPGEPPHTGGEGHTEKTYFGIPGWILKLANMILFIGVLVYFVGGPVKTAFRDRSEQIRRAADEARERRVKADQMAGDIQARLTQIESEVRAIHERAQAEGERQKRELISAAETEAQKILAAAKSEVDNRLKHARKELTEYAGQLATERAEAILKEKITEQDQRKLFDESLRELSEVQG